MPIFKAKQKKQKRKLRIIYDIIPPYLARNVVLVEKKVSKIVKAAYFFLKTSKYGSIVLVLGVALFGGAIIFGFSPKIEVTEIYPTQYEGDWQDMEKALDRDILKEEDFSKFGHVNSAGVLKFEEVSESESEEDIISLPEEDKDEDESELTEGVEEETVQVEDTEPTEEDEDEEEEIIIEVEEPTAPDDIEEDVPVLELEEDLEQEEEQDPISPYPESLNEEISFFEKTKRLFSALKASAKELMDFGSQDGFTQSMEPTEKNKGEKFEDYSGIILPDVDGNILSEIQDKTAEETQTVFTKELSAVYSNFPVPKKKGELKKIKIGFSFASPKKEGEDDEIILSWSLDGENWNSASEFVLDKNYSNKDNSGYFYADVFDLSNPDNDAILKWEDVGNIKVKFSYLTNNREEDYIPFFLDAVWLETESEKLNEKPEKEEKIEVLSHKKDFKMGEAPEFKFRYQKNKKGVLISIGETIGIVDYWDGIKITAEIITPKGEIIEVSQEGSTRSMEPTGTGIPRDKFNEFFEDFALEKNGEISMKLKKDTKFKPGLYKIILKVEEDGNVQTIEYDFTWGVLAINVNKSIYTSGKSQASAPPQSPPRDCGEKAGGDCIPSQSLTETATRRSDLDGEMAYIQMAALRDDGHTICNASLKLQITNPKLQITILSTQDGTIEYSGQCSGNNVTDVPDYFAYYQVGEAGVYEMTLTRIDANTNTKIHEITDSFEVRESVPFDVERIGPSRIYPPADYEMVLKIKANQDFAGFIQEKVPSSFEITNQELRIKNLAYRQAGQESGEFEIYNGQFITQDESDGVKLLRWYDIKIKQNDELEIKYQFDAPDVSPDLHLLGPLGFYE